MIDCSNLSQIQNITSDCVKGYKSYTTVILTGLVLMAIVVIYLAINRHNLYESQEREKQNAKA